MWRAAATVSAVLLVLASLVASQPTPPPYVPSCPGQPSAYPVWTSAPQFVKRVPNGELYLGGSGDDTFYVLQVYGSYYDMGYAHGQLFADAIPDGLQQLYDWIAAQVEQSMPWIPAWLAGLIADFGVPIAFEITFNDTRPFIPVKYIQEMQGIADGAGVAAQDIFNVNMIAETIKAQCSIIGANNKATANSLLQGGLAHLRTLDGMGGSTMPIKDLAIVTVYHPNNGDARHANFAWVSFVGTVTGFGDFVGVGEKYWSGDHNASVRSVRGETWTFVTRDLIQKHTFQAAIDHLIAANRTCSIHLGIGGRLENKFLGAEVAAHALFFFNWTTYNLPPMHPAIEDVVYWDKHPQPPPNPCFPNLLNKYWGNISAELLATHVAPVAETGSLHAAIFDYPNQVAFFANARKTNVTSGPLKAYARQFTRLNMKALFAKKYGDES